MTGYFRARAAMGRRLLTAVVCLVVAATGTAALLALPADAATGSVKTTNFDCSQVNGNVTYAEKTDVYIAGADLAADTRLYFKVQAPDGTPLGDADLDEYVYTDANGDITACVQLWANVVKTSDSSQGYDDTPNNGNEYKVFVSTDSDFDPAKTDNFKILADPTPADDLTATKSATASFDRTYAWSLTKGVDKTLVQKVGGGSATFNYTVTAAVTGSTDDNYQVSGNVTVSNANGADVTGVSIADDVAGCSLTGTTTGLTITPGTTDFPYACSFTDTSTEANTATVTWDAQTVGGHPLAAGAATTPAATWVWGDVQPNLVDECVSLSDSFAGVLATTLCKDDATKSFTYPRTITVPTTGCLSYPNTATLTKGDTGGTTTASKSVSVCGPAVSSALTIGFWKNTNGNGLISSYCNPAGGSPLATYLSGLGGGSGPFAAAAGKSCSQLVTYVNGIISGATATDMNVMLKAQMLATALDVYFSTPVAAGGGFTSTQAGKNKAPSAFLTSGGVNINVDTTAVCPMVDNTLAGTATCTGGTPSTDGFASGALPGAAMQVSAILGFAATSPSPYAAGVWYGGNRTRQTVLKNLFDQINNRMAFSA